MALNLIRPSEPIPVNTIRVLYYGQPGSGKSSIAYTHKRPIIMDFDRGAHRSEFASLGTTARIDSWSDILQLTRETNNFADYDTIVIDTISKCLDYIMADCIARNPKSGNGRGALSMSGWGELAVTFKSWIHGLCQMGKDVVMIAQYVEEKDGDNVRKRPKVQGKQALALILEEADFVGFVHLNENKRTIGYRPTDDYFGKDSARLGTVVMDDFHLVPSFGANLLQQMKGAFARLTAEQAQVIETVTSWRDTINGFMTAAEFNAILPQIISMPDGAVKTQVSAILKARRESLHIGYSKETGLFTDPPAPATLPQSSTPAQVETSAHAPVEAPASNGSDPTLNGVATSATLPQTPAPVQAPATAQVPTPAQPPIQTPAPAMNF